MRKNSFIILFCVVVLAIICSCAMPQQQMTALKQTTVTPVKLAPVTLAGDPIMRNAAGDPIMVIGKYTAAGDPIMYTTLKTAAGDPIMMDIHGNYYILNAAGDPIMVTAAGDPIM